jgi:DNA-directed RNA polymerase specialized sigma24 family protein
MENVTQVIVAAAVFVVPVLALALAERRRKQRAEADARIREVSDKWPPLGRRVFELHRDGYTYLEIAGLIGLPRQDVLDELTKIYADLSTQFPEQSTRKRSGVRLFVARYVIGRFL